MFNNLVVSVLNGKFSAFSEAMGSTGGTVLVLISWAQK